MLFLSMSVIKNKKMPNIFKLWHYKAALLVKVGVNTKLLEYIRSLNIYTYYIL